MSVRARWQAWRRLRSGSHVPHPDITVRRIRAEAFSFDARVGVWVDGVERGTVRAAARRDRARRRRDLRLGAHDLTTCWTTSKPSSSAPVETGLSSADSALACPCPKAWLDTQFWNASSLSQRV